MFWRMPFTLSALLLDAEKCRIELRVEVLIDIIVTETFDRLIQALSMRPLVAL